MKERMQWFKSHGRIGKATAKEIVNTRYYQSYVYEKSFELVPLAKPVPMSSPPLSPRNVLTMHRS